MEADYLLLAVGFDPSLYSIGDGAVPGNSTRGTFRDTVTVCSLRVANACFQEGGQWYEGTCTKRQSNGKISFNHVARNEHVINSSRAVSTIKQTTNTIKQPIKTRKVIITETAVEQRYAPVLSILTDRDLESVSYPEGGSNGVSHSKIWAEIS
jgi:hypothetical protein